jgi:hypothetical protein
MVSVAGDPAAHGLDGGMPQASASRADPSDWEQVLDVRQFRVVERDSGPVNYYQTILDDPDGPLIRANYQPPLETVTLGIEIPEQLRQKIGRLRWRWRVLAFPEGGSDCIPGKADSAAAVFVTFKRGLKFYIIKYAWASVGKKGMVCDPKRNIFLARNTVLQEVDGPTQVWVREQIQPRWEFVKHFGGRLDEVPDFVGVGIMTDGDQTKSKAVADYADFSVGG